MFFLFRILFWLEFNQAQRSGCCVALVWYTCKAITFLLVKRFYTVHVRHFPEFFMELPKDYAEAKTTLAQFPPALSHIQYYIRRPLVGLLVGIICDKSYLKSVSKPKTDNQVLAIVAAFYYRPNIVLCGMLR